MPESCPQDLRFGFAAIATWAFGACGKCQGEIEIAIRDLDQTVIGNPAHDLIRLGWSLAMAARGSDSPGVTTAIVMEQIIEGYEEALAHPRKDYQDFVKMPKPLRRILRQATKREWRHLAEERTTIPLGPCFWPLSGKEKRSLAVLFKTRG